DEPNDWETRLEEFAARAGGHFHGGNTAFMIIHSEVNNSPAITRTEMVNVSRRARELFPGIKAAAGYPTTAGAGSLPSLFPWPLNIVFTWAYDVADPNHSSYVNGRYADFTSRLQSGQRVGVLVEGFISSGDPNPRLGISGEYLGTLARRWCSFAQLQPLVEHVVGFYWGVDGGGGTDHIVHLEAGLGITALEGAHRAVANAALNQGNGSCWATSN
ncbi:MAG: hypothetical protein KDD47_06380, partial [Acidobacteria bacterium]|nr:hypothetical protein [Acidobacteriota bacterium]